MSLRKLIAIILSGLCSALCFACSGGTYYTVTQTVFSSGLVFSASVLGDKDEEAVEEMLDFLNEIDASVNVNRTDSLLSRFNALSAGEKIEVDYHAYKLVSAARELYYETDGAFNVALSGVSHAWGVDAEGINRYVYGNGTVTQPPSLPSEEQLSMLLGFTDMSDNTFDFYTQDGKYYLEKYVSEFKLDLGGIAKGYCADKCRDIALKYGLKSALIKLSGNVMLVGDYYNGKSYQKWGVGVINPRKEDSGSPQYVCGFYADNDATVVTSGDYERCFDYYYEGGSSVKVCHIIDGRTLMPVGVQYDSEREMYENSDSYVISATVIGENSMLADAYSTAVCVMGAEKGARFLSEKGYKGIIFTSDKKYAFVGDIDFTPSENLYLTEYSPL